MEPVPKLLSEVLRGDRTRRPRRDLDAAAGLRAVLEDHVFALFGGGRHESPVAVSSATLRSGGQILELSDSALSRARGVLISTVFRLLVAQVHVDDPFDDALSAWRGERPHDSLLDVLSHLDADQCARLRADVSSHFNTLVRGLGPIPSSWRPRTSQRVRQLLGGGTVTLSDVIDLTVGSTHHEFANIALVDVTTSPLGAGAERVMRYHALMQTLRTSVVPLRTSIFSSATGELWTLDVDRELLMRSVDDVVTILARLGESS
jgi:hypothetical protein